MSGKVDCNDGSTKGLLKGAAIMSNIIKTRAIFHPSKQAHTLKDPLAD